MELEAEQRQGFLCGRLVLASHMWPPGSAFMHPASPQWDWCGLSGSWAGPQRHRSACRFPGQHPSPQPSQVKQQGEQRQVRGDLFPEDWG